MFGVMTAVFTRRLRLFILLLLAEGLETSASFALSFPFFFPFLFLDSVWYLEEELPCFPRRTHLLLTQSRMRGGVLSLARTEGACPEEGTIRRRSSVSTLASAIHSPRAGNCGDSASTCLSQASQRAFQGVLLPPPTPTGP